MSAANSFPFWSDQEADLREVRRVMAPGGLLLLCLRLEAPSQSWRLAPGFTEQELAAVQSLLRGVGFRAVRTERRHLGREVACVLAER